MEVKINCGDKITIPKGCKARIENGIITIYSEDRMYQDGDVIHCIRRWKKGKREWIAIVKQQKGIYSMTLHALLFTKFVCRLIPVPHLKVNDSQSVECDIRLATEEEKQTLFDALEKEGYSWNAEEKRIEKSLPRAEKGHIYFVLDEYQYVVCMTDSRDHIDNDYYLSGNYFTTKKEAEEYADKIRKLFAERRK